MKKLAILGILAIGALTAGPISVTINLSGGFFDTGLTTSGKDTGLGFTTGGAGCTGTGCPSAAALSALNGLAFAFNVPTGSLTGAGAVVTSPLAALLGGLTFTGETTFDQNHQFIESIVAGSSSLGSFTGGTVEIDWNGNSGVQARGATGIITLTGTSSTSTTPEPSSIAMFVTGAGLVLLRLRRR